MPGTEFTKFPGKDGQPTEAEKLLIDACAKGEVAYCKDLPNDDRLVSAELIVELGTGKFQHKDWKDWALHDRGLWLDGAIVPDRIEAKGRKFPASLIVNQSIFKEAVDFSNSNVNGQFDLSNCTLVGLSDFHLITVSGQFAANHSFFKNEKIINGNRITIFAQGACVVDWFMDGVTVDGAFDFNGAHVTGQFKADGAKFSNTTSGGNFSYAIFAQSAKTTAWHMNNSTVIGEFNIAAATIQDQFTSCETRFENYSTNDLRRCAIFAQNVKANSWFLNRSKVKGEFYFRGAKISDQFGANDAIFDNSFANNSHRRAINSQGIKANSWFTNCTIFNGSLDISGASILGQFNAIDSEFNNKIGLALSAQSASIRGGFFLADSAGNRGSRVNGLISFSDTKIGNRLQLAGAQFICSSHLGAAIELSSARIEGRLVMPSEPVRGIIDLSRAWCDTLEDDHRGWPNELKHDCAPCGRETKVIDGTEIEIQHLVLDGFVCEHFEYPNGKMNGVKPGEARIRWLSSQSARALKTEFDPQPWRQCALTLRNMGYDEAAQQVSIARRVRERFADGVSKSARFENWFLHWAADYGYNPWKAVRISGYFILLTACIFWLGAASCGGLNGWQSAAKNACNGQPAFVQTLFNDFEEITTGKDASGAEIKARPGYPPFHALPFAADLFVPLLDLGSDVYWRANTQAWYLWDKVGWLPVGWFLYVWQIFTILFGSIMIAIIITGFTGLLTRDDKQA